LMLDLLLVFDNDAIEKESLVYQSPLLFFNFPGSLIESSIGKVVFHQRSV